MLIVNKRGFLLGLVMSVGFLIVLWVMFTPRFNGQNAFHASDQLFNSIAKGSSYYFEDLRTGTQERQGAEVNVTITVKGEDTSRIAMSLLAASGMQVSEEGGALHVTGKLGPMVSAALDDAEAAFYNRGEEIAAKRGHEAKSVLFAWWSSLKEIQRALRNKGSFAETAFLEEVTLKGVEVAYNFYGIEPKKASENAGILSFALLFYLVYTVWWGYAILFLFEGLGMEMKASARKKEV
jgi:hypothetical protein